MASAWIEGENLHIVVGGNRLPADRIEVEAAPDQPGTLLFAYRKNGVVDCIYVDKDEELCDTPTVKYFAKKADRYAGKDN